MSALDSNHLALQQPFIARLGTVAALNEVGGYTLYNRALMGMEDDAGNPVGLPVPAGYVLFGGTARETAPKGEKETSPRVLAQEWQIVLLDRPDIAINGEADLTRLGQCIAQVMNAFKDWQPEGAILPVQEIWPDDAAWAAYDNGLVTTSLIYRVKALFN